MLTEDAEFQISQYVDNTLSATERKHVDDLLAADPAARKLLAEYRRLNTRLAQLRPPAVKWDRFAEHLSAHIESADAPAIAGRIGFTRSSWRIAAAVLVTATGMIVAHRAMQSHSAAQPTAAPSVSIVNGPEAEVANGPATVDVSVGPSPAFAARNSDARYGEGVISQGPSKVIIQAKADMARPAASPIH